MCAFQKTYAVERWTEQRRALLGLGKRGSGFREHGAMVPCKAGIIRQQPSAFSHQLSGFSHQLSVIRFQLSGFSLRQSADKLQTRAFRAEASRLKQVFPRPLPGHTNRARNPIRDAQCASRSPTWDAKPAPATPSGTHKPCPERASPALQHIIPRRST